MVETPTSGLFTHHVLENPWPLGGLLIAVALIMAWLGLREGLSNRVRIAMVIGFLGAGVLVVASLVTTAGEHGVRVTRALVDATVARDLVGGLALFADDATMHIASQQNPGYEHDEIVSLFSGLAAHFTIDANNITALRGATISSDESEVRLACVTTVDASPYPNASQWIIRVRRMSDGSWKITKLTCVSVNGQSPPLERIR